MQAAVGIKVGIPEKLRFRKACHGIGGIELGCLSVQKRVICLIDHVEKEIIRRISVRAVQCGMLKYMRKTGVV